MVKEKKKKKKQEKKGKRHPSLSLESLFVPAYGLRVHTCTWYYSTRREESVSEEKDKTKRKRARRDLQMQIIFLFQITPVRTSEYSERLGLL